MKKVLVGVALTCWIAAHNPAATRAADPVKKDSGAVQATGTNAATAANQTSAQQTRHLSGTVQSAGGGTIAIKNAKGLTESYPLSGDVSVFSTGKKKFAVSQLRSGQSVALLLDSGGSVAQIFVSRLQGEPATPSTAKTARQATDPKWGRRQSGDITSISGNSVTVEMGGQELSATVDETTVISSGTNRILLADLHVGDRVHLWAKAGRATSIKVFGTAAR
jgi:hypothetical protein